MLLRATMELTVHNADVGPERRLLNRKLPGNLAASPSTLCGALPARLLVGPVARSFSRTNSQVHSSHCAHLCRRYIDFGMDLRA